MFDKQFDFIYKMNTIEKKGEQDVKVHLLTFRTSKNQTIIVEVHEHKEESLYILKFFDKNHRLSDHKYSLLTAHGETSAILNTNIAIMQYFYAKNPFASFAFMGAPTTKEIAQNKQLNYHLGHNTKRFRLYSRVMSLFFNPARFLHVQNTACSGYLVANRDYLYPDNEAKLEKIIQKLKTCYPDEIDEAGFLATI
jgi:hypothetical protein